MFYILSGTQFTNCVRCTVDGSKISTETAIPLAMKMVCAGVKTGGADIRVGWLNPSTGLIEEIPREIEYHWTSDDNVALFYKVNTTASTNLAIFVYWGNASLTEPAANSTYGSQNVWDSNYKLVAHMNQEPNGNAIGAIKDSTSNGNNITPHNFSTNRLVDTTYGKGISFLSTVPHTMTSINNVGISGASVRTLETFTESISTNGAIANIGTNGTNYQYGIWYLSSDMYFHGHGTTDYDTGTIMPTTGNVYCAATYDGNTVRTYVGGSPTAIPSKAIVLATISQSLQLGYRYSDNTPYLTGIIGEIRISNIQRSATYVSTINNNMKNPTVSGTSPFYLSMADEPGITSTAMTITPSETPCRTGICTVTATVTWQNQGKSSIIFTPKIITDGTTYAQAVSDVTIGPYPAESSPIQITTSTLTTGVHSICPYPN